MGGGEGNKYAHNCWSKTSLLDLKKKIFNKAIHINANTLTTKHYKERQKGKERKKDIIPQQKNKKKKKKAVHKTERLAQLNRNWGRPHKGYIES